MDQQELIAVAKRMLHFAETGTTTMADEPMRVTMDLYMNAEHFEYEKEHIFRRTPLLMAMTCDLPNPGDFKTNEDTGVPIIIVRNKAGKVNAFLNVCRHRAARLEDVDCGTRNRLTCPYHAWSFDLNGKLISLTNEASFGDVDKDQLNLIALPCQEKYGLIYVSPTPGVAVDIDAILGDLGRQFASYNLDRMDLVQKRNLDMNTNWKLALDTFCEGYHFGPLHRDSVGREAFSNLSTFDTYGKNFRLGFPQKSLLTLKDKPESEWGNPMQHFSFVHFIYPNTIVLVSPGFVNYFELYPGKDVGQHRTRYNLYTREKMVSEEQKDSGKAQFDYIFSVVEHEDYWVSSNVMKGFNSGLHPYSIFGRNEPALMFLHKTLHAAIGLDPDEIELKLAAE